MTIEQQTLVAQINKRPATTATAANSTRKKQQHWG